VTIGESVDCHKLRQAAVNVSGAGAGSGLSQSDEDSALVVGSTFSMMELMA